MPTTRQPAPDAALRAMVAERAVMVPADRRRRASELALNLVLGVAVAAALWTVVGPISGRFLIPLAFAGTFTIRTAVAAVFGGPPPRSWI